MEAWPATGHAILGALMSGPKHGYEILQFLEEGLGSSWRFSTSQLYVLLKRLEGEGLLCSTLEIQDARPSKRVFSTTPAGETKFLHWLNIPTQHMRDLRIDFLAKIFFFHNLGLQGGEALVASQIEILKGVKQGLGAKKRDEKDGYRRLVYGFRISTLTAWLAWLEDEAALFVK